MRRLLFHLKDLLVTSQIFKSQVFSLLAEKVKSFTPTNLEFRVLGRLNRSIATRYTQLPSEELLKLMSMFQEVQSPELMF